MRPGDFLSEISRYNDPKEVPSRLWHEYYRLFFKLDAEQLKRALGEQFDFIGEMWSYAHYCLNEAYKSARQYVFPEQTPWGLELGVHFEYDNPTREKYRKLIPDDMPPKKCLELFETFTIGKSMPRLSKFELEQLQHDAQ